MFASHFRASLIPFYDIDYEISYPKAPSRSAILALNHSNFEKTLSAILHHFDTMFRSKAFFRNFEEQEYFAGGIEPMMEARDKVDEIRKAYADPWAFCNAGIQKGNED